MTTLIAAARASLEVTCDRLLSVGRQIRLPISYRALGITIQLAANDFDIIGAVERLCEPYITKNAASVGLPIRLYIVKSEVEHEAIRRWFETACDGKPGNCLRLSGCDVVRHDSGDRGCPNLWNIVDHDRLIIVSVLRQSCGASAYELLRLIRLIFHSLCVRGGTVPLHAAGVVCQNGALCLLGDKFAGKTTLVLDCLRRLKWSFLTNDKAYAAWHGEEVWLSALPVRAGIRPPTVERISELRALRNSGLSCGSADQSPDKRLFLSPNQIADTFKVAVQASERLRAFIHLSRRDEESEPDLRLLNVREACELLHAHLDLHDAYTEHPYWSQFHYPGKRELCTSAWRRAVKSIVLKVPTYRLTYCNDQERHLELLESHFAKPWLSV